MSYWRRSDILLAQMWGSTDTEMMINWRTRDVPTGADVMFYWRRCDISAGANVKFSWRSCDVLLTQRWCSTGADMIFQLVQMRCSTGADMFQQAQIWCFNWRRCDDLLAQMWYSIDTRGVPDFGFQIRGFVDYPNPWIYRNPRIRIIRFSQVWNPRICGFSRILKSQIRGFG